MQAAQASEIGTTPAEKILTTLTTPTFDRLCRLFRSCHALAKHARPYTDYFWMCDLDEKKGLDVGTSYRNDKQANEFTHHIAEVAREKIRDAAQTAKFLAVISDGTTDSAALEAEMVYLRHAHRGTIAVNFAGYVNVERANAPVILGAITTAVTRLGVTDWHQKLVGFGSDGASVMVGKNNGVIALLRHLQPAVQGIHCAAHRMELAYKDAMRKQPLHMKVEGMMTGIYLFYKKSPLNRSMLLRTYNTLNLPDLLPTRVGGTRWIPHTSSGLDVIIRGYEGMTTHLSQVNKIITTQYTKVIISNLSRCITVCSIFRRWPGEFMERRSFVAV